MDLTGKKGNDTVTLTLREKNRRDREVTMTLNELRKYYFSPKKGYVDNGVLHILKPTQFTKKTFFVDEYGHPRGTDFVKYEHLTEEDKKEPPKISKEEQKHLNKTLKYSCDRDDTQQSFRFNEFFIRTLDLNKIKALSLVLMIKQKYVNGRVYDWNATKMAREFNVTRYQAFTYTQKIIECKWGYWSREGDLVINSFRSIVRKKRQHRYRIDVFETDKISDIIDRLHFIVLRNNLLHQKTVGSVRGHETKAAPSHMSWNKFKNFVKKFDTEKYHGLATATVYIGMRRLSQLIKCSIDYAAKFIKRMVKQKLLKAKELIYLLASNVPDGFEHMNNFFGHCYTQHGNLYVHMGTKLTLRET